MPAHFRAGFDGNRIDAAFERAHRPVFVAWVRGTREVGAKFEAAPEDGSGSKTDARST